eukprot:1158838-Pelagomonas_calceolata.AAC.8
MAALVMALHCLCPALEGYIVQAASCYKLAIFTCLFISSQCSRLSISKGLFEPFSLGHEGGGARPGYLPQAPGYSTKGNQPLSAPKLKRCEASTGCTLLQPVKTCMQRPATIPCTHRGAAAQKCTPHAALQ